MSQESMYIHPTAVIDEGASIAQGCRIWHFCHISATARIGKDCVIGQNVYVGEMVEIGDRVKLQNNVSVYKGVTLEDDVFVGPSVVFTNVLSPRSFIEQKNSFLTTKIGKGASLGANSTILCGINIGQFAMVGAGSVVTRNVPDFAIVVGNPAARIGWVSEFGHRLVFDSDNRAFCGPEDCWYGLIDDSVYKTGCHR